MTGLESVVLAGISAALLLDIKKLRKRRSFPVPICLIPVLRIGLLLLRYWKTFSRISNLTSGNRVGVTVVCYDFSEPQQGKDICDRVPCPMKAAIRKYCAEGHDITTVADMREAH